MKLFSFFAVVIVMIGVASVSATAAPVVLPFRGDFFREYMYTIDAAVGTPPSPISFVFDTGSSDLLVPTKNCDGCMPKGQYQPLQSTDMTAITCDAARGKGWACSSCSPLDTKYQNICVARTDYGGQINEDWWLLHDTVRFEQRSDLAVGTLLGAVYNVSFGDMMNNNMRYIKDGRYIPVRSAANAAGAIQAPAGKVAARKALAAMPNARVGGSSTPSGMWGSAFSSIAAAKEPGLMDAVIAQQNLDNKFSICLEAIGGRLSIGGVLRGIDQDAIQWAKITQDSFYEVRMLDVVVGGESIGVPPSVYNALHSIVDTGTPNPNVPDSVWPVLKKAFVKTCARPGAYQLPGICTGVVNGTTLFEQGCYDIASEDIEKFPKVEFVMEGATPDTNATLVYEPLAYLTKQWFCSSPSMVGLGMSKGGQWTVIGAQSMIGVGIVFDIGNSAVGFSPKCSIAKS